jgi:hypothetical protein
MIFSRCFQTFGSTRVPLARYAWARNYSEKKITKNVECEIFQAIVEEARWGAVHVDSP